MGKVSVDNKKIINSIHYHYETYQKEYGKFLADVESESDVDLGLLASALYHISIVRLLFHIALSSGATAFKEDFSTSNRIIEDIFKELKTFESKIVEYIEDFNKKDFNGALVEIRDRVKNPNSYSKYPTKP
jgi:hypothetical protein